MRVSQIRPHGRGAWPNSPGLNGRTRSRDRPNRRHPRSRRSDRHRPRRLRWGCSRWHRPRARRVRGHHRRPRHRRPGRGVPLRSCGRQRPDGVPDRAPAGRRGTRQRTCRPADCRGQNRKALDQPWLKTLQPGWACTGGHGGGPPWPGERHDRDGEPFGNDYHRWRPVPFRVRRGTGRTQRRSPRTTRFPLVGESHAGACAPPGAGSMELDRRPAVRATGQAHNVIRLSSSEIAADRGGRSRAAERVNTGRLPGRSRTDPAPGGARVGLRDGAKEAFDRSWAELGA